EVEDLALEPVGAGPDGGKGGGRGGLVAAGLESLPDRGLGVVELGDDLEALGLGEPVHAGQVAELVEALARRRSAAASHSAGVVVRTGASFIYSSPLLRTCSGLFQSITPLVQM